ncbi:MAG: NAD(P)H-hydrate dehydratase [Eubacterium sp.]|nr:NAD(P)H-hydrate dehydratase [Candidatus Colimonas fimequi]
MLEVGYIGTEYVSSYLKPRSDEAHKGDCGRVLIIAGSVGMAGAAVLCARAALRSGAGLVTVAVPKELFNILQISVPEATCVDREKLLTMEDGKYIEKFNCVAIGPGIGVSQENFRLISDILSRTKCPVVIDADGISTLCRYDDKFSVTNKYAGDERIIMTPHPGEANRILACAQEPPVALIGRDVAVRTLADFTGAGVLLKGHRTLVTQPDDGISCNMTGNPGMATGGSGDVLTGVIGALAASGLTSCIAARCGAYVHGLAGDLAAEELGQYGTISGDIVNYLPHAFKIIVGK